MVLDQLLLDNSPNGMCRRDCRHCPGRMAGFVGAFEGDELDVATSIMRHQVIERDECIAREGDPADYIYNVAKGVVRLTKYLQNGRRQITQFLYPGDLVGIAYQERYSFSAEAATPVRVCRFPRAKIESMMKDVPRLAERLLHIASDQGQLAQDRMLQLGCKTAAERLATYLLEIWDRKNEDLPSIGQSVLPCAILELPVKRCDIADYLGLTTETLSRTLTALIIADLVQLANRNQIELRDIDGLRDLSEGAELDSLPKPGQLRRAS